MCLDPSWSGSFPVSKLVSLPTAGKLIQGLGICALQVMCKVVTVVSSSWKKKGGICCQHWTGSICDKTAQSAEHSTSVERFWV